MAMAEETISFEPSSDFIQEEDCDTLLLYLPGFKKEELRVQLTKSGLLKITGKKQIGQNKFSSFQKEHQVSPNCDTSKISAKFEGDILYVRQPKKEETAKLNQEATQPQKTIEEAKAEKNHQQQTDTQKTAENDDQKKQNVPHELPEKSVQEEPKSNNKEEKASSKNDDEDLKGKSETSTDERKNVPENINSELVNKETTQNIVSPAAKLKKARKMLIVVLAVLVAIGVGMFIRNLMWRSNPNELEN